MEKTIKYEGKIWIISEYYYPIITSTGYYITSIAEYLASNGMDVRVICTGSKYNEVSEYFFKKKEIHNGVKIYRVKVKDLDKNVFIKRLFRLLKSSIYLFITTLKYIKKKDKVLIVTNPAFLVLLMPFTKYFKKISYTLLVHDVFPENFAAIGGMKPTSLFFLILKKLFDIAYSKADKCISIGRDMSEIIKRKTKGNYNIEYIPNWCDNEDVYPIEKLKTQLFQKLFKHDIFIFQFAGNLGHAQGLDNLLDTIKLINNPMIHFLFIGGGAKRHLIQEFSKKNKNVTIMEFQDRTSQNDFLNACDVSIVTLSDGMYGLGVPSKSYNIMAAGKPLLMIGDDRSEIAMCIKEYNLGWIVKPNDPESLKSTIETIYNSKNELNIIANNSRTVAESVFSKSRILEKYYRLFNN